MIICIEMAARLPDIILETMELLPNLSCTYNRMLCFLIVIQIASVWAELIMIKEIFRHGARYPATASFSGTPKYLLGQLTNGGRRMQLLLGKQLYKQYWSKLGLPDTYNQSFIRINSSDYDRTIESAQAQLYGLFGDLKKESVKDPALAKPQWTEEIVGDAGKVFPHLNYQTVPIHVEKRLANAYSQPASVHSLAVDICPNSYLWLDQNQKSHFYKKKFKPILERTAVLLRSRFGGIFDIDRVTSLMDVYYSNISQGLPTNSIFKNEKLTKDLQYLYFTRVFVEAFLTPHQINTTISAAFMALRGQMNSALLGQGPKIYMESLHDANIINHLTALKLMDADCTYSAYMNSTADCITDFPQYSSNLIYELHRDANSSQYVRVRYNGKYKKLTFCGHPCYFDEFEKFLNDTIVPNYKQICGFILTQKAKPLPSSSSEQTGYVIAIALLSFIILTYFMYKMLTEVIQKTHRVIVLESNGRRVQNQMVELQGVKTSSDLPQGDVMHP